MPWVSTTRSSGGVERTLEEINDSNWQTPDEDIINSNLGELLELMGLNADFFSKEGLDRDAFLDSWLEGVMEVWGQVQEKLK